LPASGPAVHQHDAGGDREQCDHQPRRDRFAEQQRAQHQPEHRREQRERRQPRGRVAADQPEPQQVAERGDDDDLEPERAPGQRRERTRQLRTHHERRGDQDDRRDRELIQQRLLGRRTREPAAADRQRRRTPQHAGEDAKRVAEPLARPGGRRAEALLERPRDAGERDQQPDRLGAR